MPLVLCATATTKINEQRPLCAPELLTSGISAKGAPEPQTQLPHTASAGAPSAKSVILKSENIFFIFKVSSKSVSLKAPSRVHSALNIVRAMRQTLRCWSVTKRAELGRTWSLDVRSRSWRCLTKRKSGSGETLLLSTPPWKEGVAR